VACPKGLCTCFDARPHRAFVSGINDPHYSGAISFAFRIASGAGVVIYMAASVAGF